MSGWPFTCGNFSLAAFKALTKPSGVRISGLPIASYISLRTTNVWLDVNFVPKFLKSIGDEDAFGYTYVLPSGCAYQLSLAPSATLKKYGSYCSARSVSDSTRPPSTIFFTPSSHQPSVMKSGSWLAAIIAFSFSFSFPAGTIRFSSTPVFFVMYCEVGSTPHLFGNQAKFKYQSNVIGDVSAFQPASSAAGCSSLALGLSELAEGVWLAGALGLPLASSLLLPPEQATRAIISAATIDKLSHFFIVIPL